MSVYGYIFDIGFNSVNVDVTSVQAIEPEVSFKIYPNPASNKLYLHDTSTENYEILVYDLLGKKIMKSTLNTNSPLDISKLQSGIYIVKFKGFDQTYKLIKQ